MEKQHFNWVRPLGVVPYPNIWTEFTAKESKQSNNLVKYRIQDVPEDRFEDVIEFTLHHFLNGVQLFAEIGGANNTNLVEGYSFMWRTMLNQKMCLVCFKENSDEIIGVNIMYVSSEGDAFGENFGKKFSTDEFVRIHKCKEFLYKDLNIYKKYNVKNFLATVSLAVKDTYRGLGIGQKILESRKPLCQAFNVPMTHSIFSSVASNRIADKVGFQLEARFSCDEINRGANCFKDDIVVSERFGEEYDLHLKSWKFDSETQKQ